MRHGPPATVARVSFVLGEDLAGDGKTLILRPIPRRTYHVRTRMSDFRLDNYIRMYRKRLAFSQAEVAFLLGLESGADVSRHEQNRRVPSLDAALAYEIILGQPVGELFAGRLERLRRRISLRAGLLAEKLRSAGSSTTAELGALTKIANPSFDA